MKVYPNHNFIQYSGRIDFDNILEPLFIYAGSYLKIRFRITSEKESKIKLYLRNFYSYYENTVGIDLDGHHGKIVLNETEDNQEFILDINSFDEIIYDREKNHLEVKNSYIPSCGVHEIIIYKRMDACHYYGFCGLDLPDESEILELPDLPKRKIEFFGDSISCGEISEAVECEGKDDPENHNGHYTDSWYSYSWQTARRLNAEVHITSQGGSALLDETGWFHGPDFIGMETMYDKYSYNPNILPFKKWNFDQWKPNVAVIALGQNDNHPINKMADGLTSQTAKEWMLEYRHFIENIMMVYPNAQIVLTTTIMFHDAIWDEAIEMVCQEINNEKVTHFLYSNNGQGTPGHVRIREAEKMADELAAYIDGLGDIWNED